MMSPQSPHPGDPAAFAPVLSDPPEMPPDGFDALNATPEELESYWLPARPAAGTELYDHWKQMLTPAPGFVRAGSARATDDDNARDVSSVRALSGLSRIETSRNWSGAYMVPDGDGRFNRIVGRWKVPSIQPGRPDRDDDDDIPFQCSVWIGLGGKKLWDASLPQVGTTQTRKDWNGPQTQSLWWQWWIGRRWSRPWTFGNVPVDTGDLVLCSLTAMTPTSVRFHVVNRTKNIFATQGVQAIVPLAGATAEWIVERPADPGRGQDDDDPGPPFAVPVFDKVVIDRCVAVQGAESPRIVPLRHPRLIRMAQIFADPDRSVVVAVPSVPPDTSASVVVTYKPP